MAHYLVRARPRWECMGELRRRLDGGEIRQFRPFGPTLDESLRRARVGEDGVARWEEEDYCQPPLKEERAAVLDAYFRDLEVTPVAEGEGWKEIEHLPALWSRQEEG